MQCQAQGLRAKCHWRVGDCAAKTGTECRAEGRPWAYAIDYPRSRSPQNASEHSPLFRRTSSSGRESQACWKNDSDCFQLRHTWSASNCRPFINFLKLGRRVAAAAQSDGGGAAAEDVGGVVNVSSSTEAVKGEELPAEVGWVRRKWTENRAEYERLRGVLKDLGLAGFLSYGLFNTGYYLVSFFFVWFFVAPSPGKLGIGPAAKRFIKIFAMVWAGSQVTKLLRAGGALLLAPLVDRGLDWFTAKGKFRSKAQAFWAIVGSCIALALVIFVVIVSLWA